MFDRTNNTSIVIIIAIITVIVFILNIFSFPVIIDAPGIIKDILINNGVKKENIYSFALYKTFW